MASILGIDTIQHQSGTTAMTISNTGVIAEPNRPCFHVTKSSDQTISDATLTLVTFDEITDGGNSKRQINVGGGYASNKFTVTAQTTGIYFFYTNIFFQATDTIQDAYVYFRKNGSADIQMIQQPAGPAGSNVTSGTWQNNCLINLDTAGDYIELMIYADVSSGGTMNLNQNSLSDPRTTMGAYKVA